MLKSIVKLPTAVGLFGMQQIEHLASGVEDALSDTLDTSKDVLDKIISVIEDNMDDKRKKTFQKATNIQTRLKDRADSGFKLSRLKPSELVAEAQKGVDKIADKLEEVIPEKEEAKEAAPEAEEDKVHEEVAEESVEAK